MAARHEEEDATNYENAHLHLRFVCTGLSNDDVGVARGNVCRRYARELVSKPAIWLKKSWGATVEPLVNLNRRRLDLYSGLHG